MCIQYSLYRSASVMRIGWRTLHEVGLNSTFKRLKFEKRIVMSANFKLLKLDWSIGGSRASQKHTWTRSSSQSLSMDDGAHIEGCTVLVSALQAVDVMRCQRLVWSSVNGVSRLLVRRHGILCMHLYRTSAIIALLNETLKLNFLTVYTRRNAVLFVMRYWSCTV